MKTFNEYLKNFYGTTSPAGKLAKIAESDPNFPKNITKMQELIDYLMSNPEIKDTRLYTSVFEGYEITK